jgi:serine/threonine-protein kinase
MSEAEGADEEHAPAVPGYELYEEIGQGGMGVVYRARDLAFGRDVAVKLLQGRFPADGVAARRFRDEARITGQLQHPGIPAAYHTGALADGRPFLAMKLIKGRTLDALLVGEADRGRLVAAFEAACQAVGYAHAHGVVHRDLKPANVMVGSFGEVQVMDWGLAKVLAPGRGAAAPDDGATAPGTELTPARGADDLTQAGSLLGTPAYMPPEQAIGAVDQVDARSDVFGLGAILCTLLTGRPPYAGDTAEGTRQLSARAKLGDAYARLDGCGADPELVALCKRCLSPERADRPADGGAVAAEVAALRAAADDRARQAELDRVRAEGEGAKAAAEAREQRKRRRVQAVLALAFAALVAVGGAFAWWARENRLATDAEARDRRVAAEREWGRAIEDATAAHGRAVRAGRDPARWAEARAAARQAVDRAAALDAPADVQDRAGRLAAEVEQAEKNRRLVATLLDVQAGMGDNLNAYGFQDYTIADRGYERAFREYGVDLFAMTPEAASLLLCRLGGDVRVELAAALDDWAYVRYSRAPDRVEWYRQIAQIFRVTRLLDPDPVRNRIRDAVAGADHQALGRVAREIDPTAHPAQTVNLVSVFLPWIEPWALEAAAQLLRRAQPHHPGDFQINHNLAFFLLRQRRFADALPYAAAAVAVRPRSGAAWDDLARALAGVGRAAEAAAAHRRVYAVAPRNLTSRLWAITLLDRTRDRDGAAAARAELGRLSADSASLSRAYSHLAIDLQEGGDQAGADAAIREAVRLVAVSPSPPALEILAWIRAAGPAGLRDGRQAVGLATRACELTVWKKPHFIETLAMAHAEVGDYVKAVEFQKKALGFPTLAAEQRAEARERLALYEQNKPYRDPRFIRRDVAPPPREGGR